MRNCVTLGNRIVSFLVVLVFAGASYGFVLQDFDGVLQPTENGWRYQYNAAGNIGYYMDVQGTAAWRFAYQYSSGQWWQYETRTSWNRLGASGQSSVFVGDGAAHTLGNGWSYFYTSAGA